MAYLVLARKYRPQRFEEVLGQEHVTRTLQNAIEAERLGHAFLFSGPRGVGKTTTARLLAKAVNCEDGPTAHPCNSCEACRSITSGASSDVLEIDGASHRGIDEVRSLQEVIGYRPSQLRTRVCIIDEVHMLTNEAFNALLKVLEEPPRHVKFVLATTEPHKVKETIASRCQRYAFRLIPADVIQSSLREIVESEEAEAEPEALQLLARCATGSLRDAQSLLDQAMASTSETLSKEMVRKLLGVLDPSRLTTCLGAALSGDEKATLETLAAFFEEGTEVVVLYDELFEMLGRVAVYPFRGAADDVAEAEAGLIEEIATQTTPATVERAFQVLSGIEDRIRRTHHPRILLEMTMLGVARLPDLVSFKSLLAHVRVSDSERPERRRRSGRSDARRRDGNRQRSGSTKGGTTSPASNETRETPQKDDTQSTPKSGAGSESAVRTKQHAKTSEQPVPSESADESSLWLRAVKRAGEKLGGFAGAELRRAVAILGLDNGHVTVGVKDRPRADVVLERLEGEWNATIREALSEQLERPIELEIEMLEADSDVETITENADRQRAALEKQRREAILAHPVVKKAHKLFEAKLKWRNP